MTAIVHTEREQWNLLRRSIVTASDCAAILGADPRRSSLSVYAAKIGATEDEDNDWLAFGRDVEGAIAKGYTRKTGRPTQDLGGLTVQIHPDLLFLGATLDRQTEGSDLMPAPAPGVAPLEIKAVGGRAVAEWKDQEPVWYSIQLQIQCAVTNALWGSLAPMFHGLTIEVRDQVRNDRFLTAALPRLEEFHLRVLRRDPPEETDALPSTSAALRALFPGNGETVALDEEATRMTEEWERAKAAKNTAEGEADELENKLRRRLAGATWGLLLDGTYLQIRETKRVGYTVAPTTYTVLGRYRPKVRRRA